jgi:hypothetical protein
MFFWRKLDLILQIVYEIKVKEVRLMSEITDLKAAVDAITTAVQAAIADIQALSTQIANSKDDPAAMEDAASKLNALAQSLTAAVTPTP